MNLNAFLFSHIKMINTRRTRRLIREGTAARTITALIAFMALLATVEATHELIVGTSEHEDGTTHEGLKVEDRSLLRKKGGRGSGSGSWNSKLTSAYVNGEYYGCLALSDDQLTTMKKSGLSCDYTVHQTDDEGDGYTLSYNYDDSKGDAADGSDASNGQANNNNGQTNENTSTTAKNSEGNTVVSAVDGDYETPYEAFDLQFCDSYEHLWTWDLEISCGQTTDYHDCHCAFAEVLMEKGQLTCDAYHSCPKGCSICRNCLKLLRCDDTFVGMISSNRSAVVVAITLITLLVAGVCVEARKRQRKQGKLHDHLMENGKVGPEGKVWMVPVTSTAKPSDGKGKMLRPVWLVPDSQSVSTGASAISLGSSSSTASSTDYRNAPGEVIDLTEITSPEEKKRYTIRPFPRNLFPDILAPASSRPTTVSAEQELPPRAVITSLTDMTGLSSSDEEDENFYQKKYVPRRQRQQQQQEQRLRSMAIAAGSVEDEVSEYTNSYTSGSGSGSSYYSSSQRQSLDLPSLTGGGPPSNRVPGDPPVHFDPPGNRNTFSSHVYRTV